MTQDQPIFDKVQKFFAEAPWFATRFPGQPVLRFNYEGQNGSWVCIAHARDAEERFVFYSIGVTEMPEDVRPTVGEFITRANFGLIIGNFEMDLDDGEVRFKTSIDVEGDRLSTQLIRQMVFINLQMMDRYLPGIRAVVEGRSSAKAAIEMVEGPGGARDISV